MPDEITSALVALSDAEIDLRPKIDEYWIRVLRLAVEKQLQETCFLMYKDVQRLQIDLQEPTLGKHTLAGLYRAACDHADCAEFWFSLTPEERPFKFYCLGAPSLCSSCGERINSIVYAIDGRLEKNACPFCGVTREDTRLPRDEWWEALGNQAGNLIQTLDATTRGVMTALIGKLAGFYVRGHVVTCADTTEGRNAAVSDLYHILWDKFGNTHRNTCWVAARWAVWHDTIIAKTGLQGLDEQPLTMIEAMLPALIEAREQPGIAESIREIMEGEDSFDDRRKALRRLVSRREESTREEPARAPAVRVVGQEHEWLIVAITSDLDGFRSHLNIDKDVELDPDNQVESWIIDLFEEDV